MVERIMMVDLTTTQAQAKGVTPSTNRAGGGGGETEAAVAKPPNALPPPTTDGVDMLYHQLVEIYAIAVMQLAESTR
jgi:hypothetical protein